jgi:hypothetical protein
MSGPPHQGGFVVTTKHDLFDHSKDTITNDTLKKIIAALGIALPTVDDITSIYISTFVRPGVQPGDPKSK